MKRATWDLFDQAFLALAQEEGQVLTVVWYPVQDDINWGFQKVQVMHYEDGHSYEDEWLAERINEYYPDGAINYAKEPRMSEKDKQDRPDAGLVQDHDEVDLTERIREENKITTQSAGDTADEEN